MAALLSEFEYDVFISYRQNDNKYDGWVTKFVENLQKELEATIKVNISVYFDENPHDGLLDTHQVDESLATKLKCLIFIPIVSQTYCDTTSFAWQHEFMAFKKIAGEDSLGMFITLPNGNVCSRVLPVKIHNLDQVDQDILENELGGSLRSIDFIHQAPGVNRPLDSKRDDQYRGDNKTIYRDQINKVANSIKEILIGIKSSQEVDEKVEIAAEPKTADTIENEKLSFGKLVVRRNILQVTLVYTAIAIIIQRILASLITYNILPVWVMSLAIAVLIFGGFFAIGLAWAYEFGPEGLIRTSSWESQLNPYPGYKRKPFTGLVTILALALVLLFQTFYFSYFPSWFSPKPSYLTSKTIAVLPFLNTTENISESNYFSKDLTEQINIELSKIQSLTVRPPNSTQGYTGDSLNYRIIGKELNASVLLIGSTRLFENQLRIICQLIDVENNKMIWGELFNRQWQDVFKIQNEIAIIIAGQLEIELSESEIQSIEKVPTKNISAYGHYLLGREYYEKYNKEANDSAVIEFNAAIKLDSAYALAWAGLGDAYSQRNSMYGQDINWNDSSIYAANRALTLDPTLKEAYKALGNIYNYETKYEQALGYFKQAVAIDSNYASAIGNIGSVYHSLGQLDQSVQWQLKGARLNPTSFIPPLMLGWTYRELHDYDKAELWLNKSLNILPFADTYRELGFTYVLQGKRAQAIDLLPNVIALGQQNARNYEQAGLIALYAHELDSAKTYFTRALNLNRGLYSDPNSISPIASAYFMLGTEQHNEAIAELERLENMYINIINKGSEDDDHWIYMAGINSMLGNEKEALQWIQRAIDAHWTDLAAIDHFPWFEQIRTNQEYLNLISDLKHSIEKMKKNVGG